MFGGPAGIGQGTRSSPIRPRRGHPSAPQTPRCVFRRMDLVTVLSIRPRAGDFAVPHFGPPKPHRPIAAIAGEDRSERRVGQMSPNQTRRPISPMTESRVWHRLPFAETFWPGRAASDRKGFWPPERTRQAWKALFPISPPRPDLPARPALPHRFLPFYAAVAAGQANRPPDHRLWVSGFEPMINLPTPSQAK